MRSASAGAMSMVSATRNSGGSGSPSASQVTPSSSERYSWLKGSPTLGNDTMMARTRPGSLAAIAKSGTASRLFMPSVR